jgi:type III pantothenate kinase
MLLVVDVGNTNTVVGFLEGDEVRARGRFTTQPRTTDETGFLLTSLLEHRRIDKAALTGAIIGSVVPGVVYSFQKAASRYLGLEMLVVGPGLKTRLKVRTDNPREVGADRIVNSVAAVARWGAPIVVVDFGTATTFDCVNEDGDYVGGAIAPGFRISEEALVQRTAKLPRVEVRRPPRAIGTNTVDAIQSGLYFGYVGLVDAVARRCVAELAPGARVVATGGLATLLSGDSEMISEVDPFLTLRGLAILHGRNQAA